MGQNHIFDDSKGRKCRWTKTARRKMRNKQDFHRDQLSRWFPPDNPFGSFSDDEVSPLSGGIFSSSLIRDVSNHLMPFCDFSSRKKFSIELQPASKLFKELLA